MKYWQSYGLIATISCIIGVALWIAVLSITTENGNGVQLLYKDMAYMTAFISLQTCATQVGVEFVVD